MSTMANSSEKREVKRRLIELCTFAVLRHPANVVGQITDISLKGLAFNYLSPDVNPTQSDSIDILAGEGLCVEHVEYQIINDIIMPHDLPIKELIMHHQSICFYNLNDSQKIQLRTFIKTHCRVDSLTV